MKSVAQVKKLVMAKMWSIDAHIVQPDDRRSPASAGKSRFLERSPIVHFRILEMESDQNSAMRGHGDSAEPRLSKPLGLVPSSSAMSHLLTICKQHGKRQPRMLSGSNVPRGVDRVPYRLPSGVEPDSNFERAQHGQSHPYTRSVSSVHSGSRPSSSPASLGFKTPS